MIGRIQAWLAGLGVALAAIGAAWLRGRSQGRADGQTQHDKAYRETRERIDAVETSDLDGDTVDERLRKHADKR